MRGYCDNLLLYQGSSGQSPVATGQEKWTDFFSEEVRTYRDCDAGYVVTQMQCSGSNCDNKRLRCEPLTGEFSLGDSEWESNTFSDEQGMTMCSSSGGVVTGWQCSGQYCDNQKLRCAVINRVLNVMEIEVWAARNGDERRLKRFLQPRQATR